MPEPAIIRCTPTVGAEIVGLDLSQSLDEARAAWLQAAFAEHKVLFFREQSVDQARLVALSHLFGGAAAHGTYGSGNGFGADTAGDHAAVTRIVHDADHGRGLDNCWHTDSMFWSEPPRGVILRAVELPSCGGDTMFADMNAAFASLDEDLQVRMMSMIAVHDAAISAGRTYPGDAERIAEITRRFPPRHHPLVRVHPLTGQLAVYASEPNTSHIVGLDPAESALLLAKIFALTTVPEFQCRFRWSPGAIAVWDNRVLQYYAVFDYGQQRRVMERVLLAGERPIGLQEFEQAGPPAAVG